MILLTFDDLKLLYPRAPKSRLAVIAKTINQDLEKYNVTTSKRLADFLAQLGHESLGLTIIYEMGGRAYFNKYDGRRDLGNTVKGDGYRYRGRGAIQTTGKANYALLKKETGIDFIGQPDLAASDAYLILTALLFWKRNGLIRYSDRGDFKGLTKRINGGYNGLKDRQDWLVKSKPIAERAHIRAVQQKLRELCRYEVGMADGVEGTRLTAALAGFQKDEGLPINGKLTKATLDALQDAKPRKVPEQRKEATVSDIADDRVVKVATKSKIGAGAVIAGGAIEAGSNIIDKADDISEKAQKAKTLWETIESPLGAVFKIVVNHPIPFLIVAGGLVVLFIAYRINHAALRNYQTGKTA